MASTRFTSGLKAASLAYLASLASALPALGEFKFQGCYTDDRDQRSLTGKRSFDPAMTFQMCAAACDGYQWFGVEYGSQCYCGTSLVSTAEKRPDMECSMRCGGSRCQTCGDADRLTVFWTGKNTTGSNLDTVGGFRYQSCWADDITVRSLTGSQKLQSDMMVEMCADFCKDFRYFGVEYSSQCYCGDELGGEAAPEGECSELCGGNSAEWCGGPDRMNIYVAIASSTASELPATSSAEPTSTALSSTESSTATESSVESTTAPETTTVPPADEVSTTTPEATSTVSAEVSTMTTQPTLSLSTEDSTTTIEVTPTALPETSTTSTPCEITTVFLPTPTDCWVGIPTACASLNSNPTLPYGVASPLAAQCKNAFLAGTTVAPSIAPCFTAMGTPAQFTATSVYSCVASASVYCQPATVCKPSAPVATNVLGEGGFEDAQLWPQANVGSQMGNDAVIASSVSAERARTGSYALKTVFSNTSGGSRAWAKTVRLNAGATYELSWWFWSENARASTVTRMQFVNPGSSAVVFDTSTYGQPTGQWVRTSKVVTTASSFATVYFSVYGNWGAAANVVYVDDISIVQVD